MYRSLSEIFQKILRPRQNDNNGSPKALDPTRSAAAWPNAGKAEGFVDSPMREPKPAEISHAFQQLWEYLQLELRRAESSRTGTKGLGLVHLEKGLLPGQQAYIFCQALQSKGILLCQTNHGWQLFSAHKIIATETFVRSANLLDYCKVEQSLPLEQNKSAIPPRPRISSELFFQGSYAPLELYLQKLGALLQELH
jgi:hypothetical protein